MIKIYLTVFLIILHFELFGQNDSLLNEILNYSDLTSEFISRARGLIIKSLSDGNFEKVKEIKNYLINEIKDPDYEIFSPREYQLLLYWTGEYNEITKKLDAIDLSESRQNIKPQNDLLYEKVLEKTRQSMSYMESVIRSSGLSGIKKDFLSLNLRILLLGDDFQGISQDELNDLSDQFLKKYPNNPHYEYYIRNYIRNKLIPAKWGRGGGFYSGYEIFTENLGKYYRNNIPIGFAIDLYYQKLAFNFRVSVGFTGTKMDIPYNNTVWAKGSSAQMMNLEASLGYVYIDKKNYKFSFFSGIGVVNLGPEQYDININPVLKKANMTSECFSLGMNYDIKLGKSWLNFVRVGPKESYTYLRFRYAYYLPQFQWEHDGFNGNMHSLIMEIGGFERRIIRD